jgi:hypothetical protein
MAETETRVRHLYAPVIVDAAVMRENAIKRSFDYPAVFHAHPHSVTTCNEGCQRYKNGVKVDANDNPSA